MKASIKPRLSHTRHCTGMRCYDDGIYIHIYQSHPENTFLIARLLDDFETKSGLKE